VAGTRPSIVAAGRLFAVLLAWWTAPAPAAPKAAAPPPAPAPVAVPPAATITLVTRSIGSRRGEPPARQSHAALLVRWEGRADGFIVQGGPMAVPGATAKRCMGWVIPAADPAREFTRAVGAFWGENTARELPTREIRTWQVPGLGEAQLREAVEALNRELEPREYRFVGGPSSNSYVSRILEKLRLGVPPASPDDLPGWGWKP